MGPQDIKSQGEAYQALSEADKQRLAAHAAKPRGAATALMRGPAKRWARVPAGRDAEGQSANPPKIVFPSTTETQGIAICEGLSAGLPVVAVNAGGIPENVEPGADGFLTQDDPAEFADRIASLIDNPQRRADMARRARANAANFSIERMVTDFERLYSSVL